MSSPAEEYMRRALDLARRGIGSTSPNPRVGAVLVSGDHVVGEGWHERAGEPHAEALAIKKAGDRARDADLYVNLEPCSTIGRTPPCTEAILRAGIRKVFVGRLDPNPAHNGKAIEILRSEGIETEVGVLEDECRKLNEGFEKYITCGLPFVTVKAAMSLDGRIATRTRSSKWITGERSRKLVHMMRSEADAIMVGIGTVRADNPRLTVRAVESDHDPRKIVIDARADISADSALLSSPFSRNTIIATTSLANRERIEAIEKAGAEVMICASQGDRVDLEDMMKKLAGKGIIYVLVEGGGELNSALLEAGLVDKIAFFYAPVIIGGKEAVSSFMGQGIESVADAVRIHRTSITRIDGDFLVEGYVERQG